MKKWKAQAVTCLIMILLAVLIADVVAVIPGSLPWILGVFALPGVWLFAKLLFSFLTTDDDGVRLFPRHRKKAHSVDWTRVWAGKPEKQPESHDPEKKTVYSYAWYNEENKHD